MNDHAPHATAPEPAPARRGASDRLPILVTAAYIVPFLAIAGTLFYLTGPTAFMSVTRWLDPVLFQYNLLLLLVGVLIIPSLTYFYCTRMRGEKKRRLRLELGPALWARLNSDTDPASRIENRIELQFSMRHYAGTMTLVTVLVTLGAAIILFLKPIPLERLQAPGTQDLPIQCQGLNFGQGANFLMLGPYMEYFIEGNPVYYHYLISSLTAFQFGFLGAYLYFITQLVRAYFTLDLRPNTFVDNSVRMSFGSLLAVVLSFMFPAPASGVASVSAPDPSGWIPVLSFFVGFFPSRGLLILEKYATALLNVPIAKYESVPLSVLSGMSYAHEVQLNREGFDNAENLAHADPVELVLRTGFLFAQLREWIGEAWLRVHMGSDYPTFRAQTGITGAHELVDLLAGGGQAQGEVNPCEAGDRPYADKLRLVCRLLPERRTLWDTSEQR